MYYLKYWRSGYGRQEGSTVQLLTIYFSCSSRDWTQNPVRVRARDIPQRYIPRHFNNNFKMKIIPMTMHGNIHISVIFNSLAFHVWPHVYCLYSFLSILQMHEIFSLVPHIIVIIVDSFEKQLPYGNPLIVSVSSSFSIPWIPCYIFLFSCNT